MDKTKKIYNSNDVSKILGLGKSKTYEFLKKVYQDQSPFKVIKIGREYKIFKESFDTWLNTIV
jgi:hypothetical protein